MRAPEAEEKPKAVTLERLKASIRDVPDFPKPGIVFKDITPLLQDADLFEAAVKRLAGPFSRKDITHVASVESRGFIFGAPVAYQLGAGYVPIRKKGKLPYKTTAQSYDLEYGTDILEIHGDAFGAGSRVLLIDDVLATGGTAQASCKLVKKLGAKVIGCAFLVELAFLKGREKLNGVEVLSLLRYD